MKSNAMIEALSRRDFLARAGMGTAAVGLTGLSPLSLAAAEKKNFPKGKAEHCIFLWLAGGMAHVDTFDPKRLGDPAKKIAGSAYPAINTAIRDVQVCEHLNRTADLLDRFVLLRTVNHTIIDEHSAATNFVHTGRRPTGTIVYPSIGSLGAHQLCNAGSRVPPHLPAPCARPGPPRPKPRLLLPPRHQKRPRRSHATRLSHDDARLRSREPAGETPRRLPRATRDGQGRDRIRRCALRDVLAREGRLHEGVQPRRRAVVAAPVLRR